MIANPLSRVRYLVAVGAVAMFVAAAVVGRSEEPADTAKVRDPIREQKIADIEKQIAELNKALADLKKTETITTAVGTVEAIIPAEWAQALQWRCIGPANMGGRITAMSVYEADPTTYWVATASGGLVKTANNGVTFEHQFDHEATVSVGDVCVAPSNKEIVYVGTGENNPRNSVSYGDGVYKSTDGGKHWANVGLKKSFQVGKIIVHPKNPDIVYVGALGRLYGPNEERGVFKTTDGGKSWNKVLFIDDKTGVIDMRMNPADPEMLIVATWERKRDEFDAFFGDKPPVPDGYGPMVTYGPGTALYKTTDGFKTHKKLTKGLPTVKMGRIGLDWSRKNPNVVFAIIDTEKAGTGLAPVQPYLGVQGEDVKDGAKLTAITEASPAEKGGLKIGDVVRTVEGKAVAGYDKMVEEVYKRKPNEKVKLGIEREGVKSEITVTLGSRPLQQATGGPGGGRGGQGGGRQFITPGFFGEDVEGGGVEITRFMGDNGTKAGLKEGDIVTKVDGQPVTSFRETFRGLMSEKKVGDKIKLSVERGKDRKEKLEITVTLEEGRGFGGGGGGGTGGPTAEKPYATQLGGQRENGQDTQGPDGWQTGGVYKSTDAGESWTRINSLNPRPMYFSQIRVDPSNDDTLWVCGISFYYSFDGGKKFQMGRRNGVHDDLHALWIDPRDGRHMIVGGDGGFYASYDQGLNWDHHNFMALGQFYHIAIDSKKPYHVYGGLQDNGSWGGPSMSLRGGIVNEDWIYVSGGDGFVCRVDPNDPDVVYAESQGGAMNRRNLKTGERASISPRRPAGGGFGGGRQQGGGTGTVGGQPAPAGTPRPAAQSTGATAVRYRFNWNTPYILSSHNTSIFYCASQFVHRSLKRGDELKTISPEITRSEKGSGTALCESPKNADVIWAGTDDGNLWITKDGGAKWTEVSDNVIKAGLPAHRWVSTIEASRFTEGRAYVCFDGHRSDDDKPYLFVTEDYGVTWKNVTGNLPWGSTRCCREDIQNQDVLYAGTEFGIFASANRGTSWTNINNKLPTVAVHEIAQHPQTGDLVIATHGRSVWVLDASPIRQLTKDALKATAHLYVPPTATRYRIEQNRGMFSGAERKFVGDNPPRGALVYYSLTKKAEKVELKVMDYAGQVVRKLEVKTEPGLYRATWDFARLPNANPIGGGQGGARQGGQRGTGAAGAPAAVAQRGAPAAPATPGGPATESPAEGGTPAGPGGGGGGRFGFGGPQVASGTYRVVLTVDGQEFSQPLRVEGDPASQGGGIAEDEDEEMEEHEMERDVLETIDLDRPARKSDRKDD